MSSLTGVPSDPSLVSPSGAEMLPFLRGMIGGPPPAAPEVPDESRLGPVQRYVYLQKIGSDVIENASIVVQHSNDGRGPFDIVLNAAVIPPVLPVVRRTPNEAATFLRALLLAQLKDVDTSRAYALPDFLSRGVQVEVDVPPPAHWLAHERSLRLVYDVLAAFYVETPCGRVPVALREFTIDAASDDPDPRVVILRFKDLVRQFRDGQGRVFDPNPIATLNLQKFPNPLTFPVDAPPYFMRPLRDLDEPAELTYKLSGRYVSIDEIHCPDSKPEPVTAASDAMPVFAAEFMTNQFAATNAYYHVDTLARWVDSIGFGDSVPARLPIDVNAALGSTPAAFYVPKTRKTDAHIWLSELTLGIFTAEDGDWLAHEYGHAVLDFKTHPYFTTAPAKKGAVEACAINEGFADYWALSASYKQTTNDPRCWGEWAKLTACRQIKLVPYKQFDPTGSDHTNGIIWAATLLDIFEALGKKRELSDTIILQGHLGRATAGDTPTMKQMAKGILIADAQRFSGAHAKELCKEFNRHGIERPACCNKKKACTANWRP